MPRPCFYRPPGSSSEAGLVLPDRETHHARHVLRLGPGDQAWLLDGQGGRWLCQVSRSDRQNLHWDVLEHHTEAPPPWQITLFQAVTKAKSMEWLLQKATELGAHHIVPLLTERTVVHPDPDRAKPDKWRWVAIDAMKQCHSAWLPRIDPPTALPDALQHNQTFDLALAALPESGQHAADPFRLFRQKFQRPPQTVALWIGPEGGFTAAEAAALQSRQIHPVSLGPRVLRAETAALCALAIAHHELSRPL